MTEALTPSGSSDGPATDAQNDPVVDPTKNVLQLVEAAIARQDDLRKVETRHVREILSLREKLYEEETRRVFTIAELQASHNQELRTAEKERINAIRQVDVEAVQRAAEVQATQANALANQVTASAEAMRTQVAAAATAATTGLSAALEPIQKDIQDLRKAQYEAQGQKTQVVEGHAAGANVGLWVGIAISAFIGLIAVASVIVAILTNHP